MPIAAATPATAGAYSPQTTRTPKQELDGEAFMALLVTQLRNQDPSTPMDTSQMIAQVTQLAMMEKLTSLATSNDENFSLQMRMAASALIGQEVTHLGADGVTVSGVASAVSFAGPVPQVTIAGMTVPLDQISGLNARPTA